MLSRSRTLPCPDDRPSALESGEFAMAVCVLLTACHERTVVRSTNCRSDADESTGIFACHHWRTRAWYRSEHCHLQHRLRDPTRPDALSEPGATGVAMVQGSQ